MKHISKILLFTFIFTMFITSTCFAAQVDLTWEEYSALSSFYEDFISENSQYADKPYTFHITEGNSREFRIYDSSTLQKVYTTTNKYEIVCLYRANLLYENGSYNSSSQLSLLSFQEAIKSKSFVYISNSFVDDTGTAILWSTTIPQEPEPEEPEQPTVTLPPLPETDYANNYAIKYVHTDGSTRLVLFSSHNPIAFSTTVKDKTATITFNYTAEAKYSTYIFRNDMWDGLINSTYSTVPGSFTQSFTFESILSSDIDIYNEDGTIFFPQTPLLEKIAGAGLTEMVATIMKAILVIVTLAVSCLALLSLFKILYKLLRTYLG